MEQLAWYPDTVDTNHRQLEADFPPRHHKLPFTAALYTPAASLKSFEVKLRTFYAFRCCPPCADTNRRSSVIRWTRYETRPAAVANRTESGTKQTADLSNREKSESCIIAVGVRHRIAVLKQLDTEWECLDVCVADVTVAVRGRAQGGGERNGLVAGTWSDKQELIDIRWARGSSAWMAPRQCAAMVKLDAAPVHGDAAMWYQVAAVLPCDAARRGAKAADAAN
ncbi:hypothetical protein DFH06DRAFT_1134199 [Mycena polygramma]|nr:hypothetical protein DFH06DRAFT_1134199 [Mycena polygramma]